MHLERSQDMNIKYKKLTKIREDAKKFKKS